MKTVSRSAMIRNLAREGKSVREISVTLGETPSFVRKAIAYGGGRTEEEIRKGGRRRDPDSLAGKVRQMHDQGLSMSEIATKLGTTTTYVSKALQRRHGMPEAERKYYQSAKGQRMIARVKLRYKVRRAMAQGANHEA
jgi:IS30 family transposase